MIAIIDYGVGNLFSLCCSLKHLDIAAEVTAEPRVIEQAHSIILPGVGAFGDAIVQFRKSGLQPVLDKQVEKGKPLLGICVGMQLLFEMGYEFGSHKGLGYIKGSIRSLAEDVPSHMKVPQIGWNSMHFLKPNNPLLKYCKEGEYVYYVHSFYAKECKDSVVAYSEYGVEVPGIVHERSVFGTQFHPEKSGSVGLNILKAFNEIDNIDIMHI